MSTYSRRTAIRASEAPSGTSSSRRPKPRSERSYGSASRMYSGRESYSRNHRVPTEVMGSYVSGSSKQSRSFMRDDPKLASPRDFPLPRSARKIPLPPPQPGSRLVVTVTRPEKVAASEGSRLRDSPFGYTKRTTETFVFSPRDQMTRGFQQRDDPSQVSRRSLHSNRSEQKALFLARPPQKSATFPPTRISLGSRTKSVNRAPRTSSGFRSENRTIASGSSDSSTPEPTLVDFGDTETLAPSDSISVVSEKARRRHRRSSRSSS